MQIISKGLITMLSILKRTLGAVCIILAFHSKANVADLDVLIVTEHLPPYQISKDNKLIGGRVAIEIQKLMKTVLPESTIEVVPWARAHQLALVRPNTIIFSLVRTSEREDKFIWIGKVAQVRTELITLKDSELQLVETLSELKNTRIGVKRQDAVATFLNNNGFEYGKELIEIVYTMSTMRMLEKGRIETIPSNQQIIEFYCQNTGCANSDFKTVYVFKELSEEFYLAASLGTDAKLIENLKAEFTNLDLPIQ
jgi:polar amino acid transport system substrate-binding protein